MFLSKKPRNLKRKIVNLSAVNASPKKGEEIVIEINKEELFEQENSTEEKPTPKKKSPKNKKEENINDNE